MTYMMWLGALAVAILGWLALFNAHDGFPGGKDAK
jgi:hypothetical protein